MKKKTLLFFLASIVFFISRSYSQTTFSNTGNITIPNSGASTPYPSTINVFGMGSVITNVTVTVTNINHTWSDDIDIILVAPNGERLLLMSDVGGGGDLVNHTYTFSDAGGSTMADATLNGSGTYRPTDFEISDPMPAPIGTVPAGDAPPQTFASKFNGDNPNGNWSLYVADDAAGDLGNITNGWSITITACTPAGNPATSPTGQWNVYCYNAGDAAGGSGAWTNNYSGFYSISSLSFDTQTGASSWGSGSTPSAAAGYAGCPVGVDNHSYIFKRTGVPTCGTYIIDAPGHDDAAILFINGVEVWRHVNGCCDVHNGIWTGHLDAGSTIEYRVSEGGGGSNAALTFTQIPLSGTVSGVNPTTCLGNGTINITNPGGAYCNIFSSGFGSGGALSGGAAITGEECVLTTAANGLQGSMVITPSIRPDFWEVTYNQFIGSGTGADGMSFAYGTGTPGGESGYATGLTVSFDSYDNGSGTTQSRIYVYYNGAIVTSNVLNSFNLRTATYLPVRITVNAQQQITVVINGTTVIPATTLPAAYLAANKSTWTYAYSARTGGLNDVHKIDNVNLYAINYAEYSLDGTTWQTATSFARPAGNYTVQMRSLCGTSCVNTNIGSVSLVVTPFAEINVQGAGINIADGDPSPSLTDLTDFGNQSVCAGTVVRTFTIQNSGTTNLTLAAGSITVGGTHASNFTVGGITLPASIGTGGSTTFTVTFDPSALGLRTATISIANNDCNENPYDFAIQGTGIDPEINLQGAGINIADGDPSPSGTDNTDFGNQSVCAGTVVRTYTIQNTGTANLTLAAGSITIGGAHASNFTVGGITLPATIGAGGSTTFTVTFDPSVAGLRTATINIANNDCDETPYDYAIQGTGIDPEINVQGNSTTIADGDPSPSLTDHTDFGSVLACSGTLTRTYTIQNTGTSVLNISSVAITGTHASDFTVTTSPSSSVAAAGSTTFIITFDPGAAGLRTALITVNSNDCDEAVYDFAIQGTGNADVVLPSITCPGNITQPNTVGTCGSIVTYTAPIGTDNCPGPVTTQIAGLASGATYPVGTTTNTFQVTDASGNSTTCSFTITITDTQFPSITCPGNISQPNTPGVCGATVTYTAPIGTDNCPGASTTQITGLASGATFPVGITTNTFRVTDAAGNSSTCSFTVTISDTESPSIICPSNITTNTDPGICGAVVTFVAPLGTDNCPGASTTQIAGLASGATFPLGLTTNTFRVVDGVGNSSTCSFTVTVSDNTPPVANCQDVTVYLDGTGNVSVTPAQVNNGSTDNCGTTNLSFDIADQTDFDCSDIAFNPIQVHLIVSDGNGNSSTCTANVTVADTLPPTSNCQDFDVFLDGSGNGVITAAMADNGSTDNCGINNMSIDVTSVDCSDAGSIIPVVLTVTDDNGNSSTCTSNATIIDAVGPVVACQNITVYLNGSGIVVINGSMLDNGSTDNCGILSYTSSIDTLTCSNIGPNNVTLSVEDVNGNVGICPAVVTVLDTLDPVASCQNIVAYLDGTGNVTITASQVNNGSTDNCGSLNLSLDQTTFNCSNIGPNTVTLTVSDGNGNSSTCTATVTVLDTLAPIASCQNITAYLDGTGNVTITPSQINNGSTDNCGIANLLIDQSTFNCSNIGPNTVTLTVEDGNGNSSTCTATVTVLDTLDPVANCQNITAYLDVTGNVTITASQINNGSTDNCGTLNLSLDQTTFNCSNIGPNTVILTVEDGNGNSLTCTATVTVVDNTVPVITCAANVNLNVSCTPATITLTPPTVSDNCTIAGVTNNHPGTTYPAGVTTVVWTATDVNGNSSTCLQTVTVTSPEAIVTGNGWEITSGSTIISTTNGTDFGNVQLCSTMVKTYVFKNKGTGNITLPGTPNTAALSGLNSADFSIISMPPSGTVLAPGASANFTVLFDPSALGFRNARLTILNTDCNEAVYSFAIRGKGMTCSPSLVPDPSGQTQAEGNDHSEEENNTTGVEEANTLKGTLYPNPGNGIFTLELSEMPRGKTEFRLVDVLGQVIYTTQVVSQSMYYDFSYLRSGTYYVQVISNESSFTKTIIITQKY